MATLTLSRGTTSIDLDLVEEGGTPLFIGDFGKPELNVRESGGTLNPRIQDQWSGSGNFNMVTRLNSYSKANNLADLIKTCDPNNNLELSIPFGEYPDTVLVAPAAGQEAALTLTYEPGYESHIFAELTLTRISETRGSITQQATTPTDSGSGPVQLEIRNSTIDISSDLTITREVGRPNDVVRRSTSDYPYYVAKPKVAYDNIGLEFQKFSNAVSDLATIQEELFEQRLGRRPIELNFNGVFGLGSMSVVPVGSAPFRQNRVAGEEGYIRVPTFDLRRVFGTQ